MSFPIGAYIASHLTSQKFRRENNCEMFRNSNLSINHNKNRVFYFMSRQGKMIEYTPHTVHLKFYNSIITLTHGTPDENLKDEFKKLRKNLRKEYLSKISPLLFFTVGIIILTFLFFTTLI